MERSDSGQPRTLIAVLLAASACTPAIVAPAPDAGAVDRDAASVAPLDAGHDGGLPVPPDAALPDRDAGPDAPSSWDFHPGPADEVTLETEACEWTLGSEWVLGAIAARSARLDGAVHPTLDRVAVATGAHVALVDLAAGPVRFREEPEVQSFHTDAEGFVAISDTCALLPFDESLRRAGDPLDLDGSDCTGHQTIVGRFEVLSRRSGADAWSLHREGGSWIREPLFHVDDPAQVDVVVRWGDATMGIGGTGGLSHAVVSRQFFGGVEVGRAEGGGLTLVEQVALDRRNGSVLLGMSTSGGPETQAFVFGGGYTYGHPIPALGWMAARGVSATDRDALLSRDSGQIDVVALDGSSVRALGPVSDLQPDYGKVRVILRPRTNVGGVVYEVVDPSRGRELRFRPLGCAP